MANPDLGVKEDRVVFVTGGNTGYISVDFNRGGVGGWVEDIHVKRGAVASLRNTVIVTGVRLFGASNSTLIRRESKCNARIVLHHIDGCKGSVRNRKRRVSGGCWRE